MLTIFPSLFRPFFQYTKRNPFLPSFWIKNYEMIPLLGICVIDIAMMAFFPFRLLFNSDCVLSRWTRTEAEMTELLIHPRDRKLIYVSQVFEVNQELYDLLEEMKECEEELKREEEEQRKAEEDIEKQKTEEQKRIEKEMKEELLRRAEEEIKRKAAEKKK